jgi:hypothetical protein
MRRDRCIRNGATVRRVRFGISGWRLIDDKLERVVFCDAERMLPEMHRAEFTEIRHQQRKRPLHSWNIQGMTPDGKLITDFLYRVVRSFGITDSLAARKEDVREDAPV